MQLSIAGDDGCYRLDFVQAADARELRCRRATTGSWCSASTPTWRSGCDQRHRQQADARQRHAHLRDPVHRPVLSRRSSRPTPTPKQPVAVAVALLLVVALGDGLETFVREPDHDPLAVPGSSDSRPVSPSMTSPRTRAAQAAGMPERRLDLSVVDLLDGEVQVAPGGSRVGSSPARAAILPEGRSPSRRWTWRRRTRPRTRAPGARPARTGRDALSLACSSIPADWSVADDPTTRRRAQARSTGRSRTGRRGRPVGRTRVDQAADEGRLRPQGTHPRRRSVLRSRSQLPPPSDARRATRCGPDAALMARSPRRRCRPRRGRARPAARRSGPTAPHTRAALKLAPRSWWTQSATSVTVAPGWSASGSSIDRAVLPEPNAQEAGQAPRPRRGRHRATPRR